MLDRDYIKNRLQITHNNYDNLIDLLIQKNTAIVESIIRKKLTETEITETFYNASIIFTSYYPIAEVVSINTNPYYVALVEQDLRTGYFRFDDVVFSITITYKTKYEATEDILKAIELLTIYDVATTMQNIHILKSVSGELGSTSILTYSELLDVIEKLLERHKKKRL